MGFRLPTAEKYWDDSQISPWSARVGALAPTAETGFRGDGNFLALNFVHTQADEIQFIQQARHSWREESEIFPHVHFSPFSSVLKGDYAVQFILKFYQADVNGAFGSVGTYTMTKTFTYNFDNEFQWYHLIASNLTALDQTGFGISNFLVCRLYRDNTVADNFPGKVTLLGFDYHYEVDAFGSDQEYIKGDT